MSVREDLKAFVDGELSPPQMAAVQDAVDRDASLAQEVAELRALALAVKQSTPVHAARGLEETLGALRQRDRRRQIWYRLPLGLAAAAAATALAVFMWPHREEADAAEAVAFQDEAPAKIRAKSTAIFGASDLRGGAVAAPTNDRAKTTTPPRAAAMVQKLNSLPPQRGSETRVARTAAPTNSPNPAAKSSPPLRGTRQYFSSPRPGTAAAAKAPMLPSASGKMVAAPLASSPKPVPTAPNSTASGPTVLELKPPVGDVTTIVLAVDSPAAAEARLRFLSSSVDATEVPDVRSAAEAGARRIVLDVPADKLVQARAMILGLTSQPSSASEKSVGLGRAAAAAPVGRNVNKNAVQTGAANSEKTPPAGSFASGGSESFGYAGGGGGFGGRAFGGAGAAAAKSGLAAQPGAAMKKGANDDSAAQKPSALLATPATKRRIIVILRQKDSSTGQNGTSAGKVGQ